MPSQFLERARLLDATDELAAFRSRFYTTQGAIYLDGNSLGLLSKEAEEALLQALEEWKRFAVGGWWGATPPWVTLAESLSESLAEFAGAHRDEVIVANSTTVNLHQLLSTLLPASKTRPKIVTDSLGFPSTRYALQSHLRQKGLEPETHLVCVPSVDGTTLDEEEIIAAMLPEVGAVVLSSVLFQSGQLLDMERLACAANERGVLIGFDCAHSMGAMPHALHDWGVDFAFWCHYKYFNGGPGAAGGLFLHRRHHAKTPGLAGWFGNRRETQFEMAFELDPALGAWGLQVGTPAILSMAPLRGSFALFREAGLERLRRKSLAQTAFLREGLEALPRDYGFVCVTPREEARRGGHIALTHPRAKEWAQALLASGVVVDFRPPNLLRFAPAPLYNTFEECALALECLAAIAESLL